MLIVIPPQEFYTSHHTCEYHKRNPGKQWAGCTCTSSISVRQKPVNEWTAEERNDYLRALGHDI